MVLMYQHMQYRKYVSFKFQPKRSADGSYPPPVQARVVMNACNVSNTTFHGLQDEWVNILLREGYAKDPDHIRLYNINVVE